MSKISIIAPVYNCEKYLHFCIDSILAQTFADFELLLINDGSTDSSGVICDEYGTKDSRIRVLHTENGGVSSARNLGLDIAEGKYVIFIDADDYWYDTNVLKKFVGLAEEEGLDIVRGEYKAVDLDGNDLFERPLINSKQICVNKVLSSGEFYTKIICGENFLVLSLFRKESIESLRFNINKSFLEDMEFYARLLLRQLRCMYIPLRFYAYRKHATSASHTPRIKNLEDSFAMCELFRVYSNQAHDIILKEAYEYNSIMIYYWTLETLASKPYFQQRKQIIEELLLRNLQLQVRCWASRDSRNYPIPIYITPEIGVLLLRIKLKCLRFGVNIKRYMLSLLSRKKSR